VENAEEIGARRHHLAEQMARTRRGRARDGSPQPTVLSRRWSSRQLHIVGLAVSHSWAGIVAVIAALIWVAIGFTVAFSTAWQAALTCTTSIITVVMLFAMQHLQSRDQSATQRKLDEILRSLPDTDNRLIAVEERSDEELGALADMNRADRER
jgi:low affinity Fe/Cu permease